MKTYQLVAQSNFSFTFGGLVRNFLVKKRITEHVRELADIGWVPAKTGPLLVIGDQLQDSSLQMRVAIARRNNTPVYFSTSELLGKSTV